MLIQVNTDSNIHGREALVARVEGIVDGALGRFRDHLTRVEVHLSDVNGHKAGPDDKRCVMEARIEGRPPSAVTHQAETIDQAVSGAAQKLKKSIESVIGKMREHH